MKSKITALISVFVSFSTAVSAQGITTSGEGPLGGIGGGAVEFLSNLFGVNMSNPTEAIGFAAAFGILWLLVNVMMEVGLDKLNLLEYFQQSGMNQNGRNKMPILSFLVVISMLGTGAFTGVVTGLQTIILLVFVSAILAGLLAALFGLPSGALLGLGGGMKALGFASSKTGINGSGVKNAAGKAASKGADTAKKAIKEAENLMDKAGKEEKEAAETQNEKEAEHAAEELEQAEEDLKKAEDITHEIMTTDYQQVQNTLEEAREAVRMEKQEEEKIKGIISAYRKIDRRLKSYVQGLRNAVSQGKSPDFDAFFGGMYSDTDVSPAELERSSLAPLSEDAQELKKIEKKEEQLLRDELQTLQQETEELMEAVRLSRELETDLEKLEKEENYLENLSQKLKDRKLAKEVSMEEEQLRKLMQELNQIEKEEQKVFQVLKEVRNFLGEDMKIIQNEINRLQEQVQDSEQIEQEMEQLRQVVNQDGVFTRDKTEKANQRISKWEQYIEQIEEASQVIAQRKQQEQEMGQKFSKRIDNHLKNFQ